jgi:hypothetical protein
VSTASRVVPGIPHQDALLAEEPVEQRRFPNVGAAHQGHPDLARRRGRGFGFLLEDRRQPGIHCIQQVADPVSVLRGDRDRLTQAQRVQLVDQRLHRGRVHLVRHQAHGNAAAAEAHGQLAIERAGAGARVHHVENPHRLAHREIGLVLDLAGEGGVQTRVSPPVSTTERAPRLAYRPVVAVAGEAGLVGDERDAAADQPVEEGGLPHVGGAHDGDEGSGHGREASTLLRIPLHRLRGLSG